jgi:hypothetical protein
MEDHIFSARSVHHAVLLCHRGLSEKIRIIHNFKTAYPFVCVIDEVAQLTDAERSNVVSCKKLILFACCPSPDTMRTALSLMSVVDGLPESTVLGRVFQLPERVALLFPKTFDPDHYVSKGDSYYTPCAVHQMKTYRRRPSPEALLMSFPLPGGIDTNLVRSGGTYDYRKDIPRCFDPSILPSYSGKLPAMIKVLHEGKALILTKYVSIVVLAIEAAGYRRRGAAGIMTGASNGFTYAVDCDDPGADVTITSKEANLCDPVQIHVLDPTSWNFLHRSLHFRDRLQCKVYLHAAMEESYPSIPDQIVSPMSLYNVLSGAMALHYSLHRKSITALGEVYGFDEHSVALELERLVVTRCDVKDRLGTRGYVARCGDTYLFQPDEVGFRAEFEKIFEICNSEDVAVAYVLERMDFEECKNLLQNQPKSRADKAAKRYFNLNCWCPGGVTLWRKDGTLQGVNSEGLEIPAEPKPRGLGQVRVRRGKLQLMKVPTLKQLQTITASTSIDLEELMRLVELKLRAEGLVLTPVQI